MTENHDWLTDALDRHPGEPVPPEFAIRLQSRIQSERRSTTILAWPRRFALAASLFLILGLGYWLGMGRPGLHQPVAIGTPGDTATLELEEIWRNRHFLESWELVLDPEVQLGLADSMAGALPPEVLEESEK